MLGMRLSLPRPHRRRGAIATFGIGSFLVVLGLAPLAATAAAPASAVAAFLPALDLPTPSAPADQRAPAGVAIAFDLGSVQDTTNDGPWQISVDWGDGSQPTTLAVQQMGGIGAQLHTYAQDGTYVAQIHITNRTGETFTNLFTVTVSGGPTPAAAGPAPTATSIPTPTPLPTLSALIGATPAPLPTSASTASAPQPSLAAPAPTPGQPTLGQPVVEGIADPSQFRRFGSLDGSVTLTVPGGAPSGTWQLTLQPVNGLPAAVDTTAEVVQVGSRVFRLSVVTDAGTTVGTFAPPLTLAVQPSPNDLAQAGDDPTIIPAFVVDPSSNTPVPVATSINQNGLVVVTLNGPAAPLS